MAMEPSKHYKKLSVVSNTLVSITIYKHQLSLDTYTSLLCLRSMDVQIGSLKITIRMHVAGNVFNF